MINENVFAFLLAPELMETANWSSLLFQHEKLVIISYSFVHRLKHAEVSWLFLKKTELFCVRI